MMYCTNCGEEVTGKFCSECGNPVEVKTVQPTTTTTDDTTMIISRNGRDIDIFQIVSTYGKNRVQAIKQLRDLGDFSLREAKEIIDEAHEKIAVTQQVSTSDKGSFWTKAKEQAKEHQQQKMLQMQQQKDRITQMNREGIPYCPKCYSPNLSAHKKGFGVGKAAAGAILAGPLGLAAGGFGSGRVKITCLKCGHQFKPGKN